MPNGLPNTETILSMKGLYAIPPGMLTIEMEGNASGLSSLTTEHKCLFIVVKIKLFIYI